MAKSEMRDLDYHIVGSNMPRVSKVVLRTFLGALKRGKNPWAVMVWGPPGCGKTYAIYDAAKKINKLLGLKENDVLRKCSAKSLLIACMDPVDVNGFPQKHPDHPFAEYYPLRWAWEASEEFERAERSRLKDDSYNAPPMILFFDDLPVAHQQTQAAFFKVVHERMVGDLTLRHNVMMVAAGNRVEDNAAAQDMPTALGNRFRHVYANVSTDDWCEWAVKEGSIHPGIVAYIRKNPSHLFDFDEDKANSEEKAFPTPRSWENLSDAMWEEEMFSDNDPEFTKSVIGIIGRGIAQSFVAFQKTTRSAISPEEIVRDPKKAAVPNKKHMDLLYATIAGLEHYLREHPEHYKAGLIYACRENLPADHAIILAKSVTDLIWEFEDEEKRNEALSSKEFEKMFDKYGEHMAGGF